MQWTRSAPLLAPFAAARSPFPVPDAWTDRAPWPTERRLLIAVLLVFAVAVGWLQVAALLNGGNAANASAVLCLAAAAFLCAHLITRISTVAVPAAIVVTAAAFALLRFDVLTDHPLRAPLGYSNAAGALYLLAAAAALLLATRVRRKGLRIGLAVLAAGFAAVPWLNETVTAAILVCLLPMTLLARSARAVRAAIIVSAAGILLATITVAGLGATYRPGADQAVTRVVADLMSERRLLLWHDAVTMLGRDPLSGVGPGRFPEESAVARADRDTRWPHSEPLHFAAETGVPGLLLLLGLFGLGFLWLAAAPPTTGAAISAAALAAVGIHATVDYVLHYPAIPMAAAALVASVRLEPAAHRGRAGRTPLVGRLRALLRTTPADRRLLAIAFAMQMIMRVSLWVLPSKRVLRWAGRWNSGSAARRQTQPGRVSWAVRVTSRAVPASTCLTRALAAQWMLAGDGWPPTLRLGVARSGSDRIEAHAWLELDGVVIVGADQLQRYTPLPDINPALHDEQRAPVPQR